MDSPLIIRSFELAAERCEDLTPIVYRRLFAEHPEFEAFFVLDRTGEAKGSMLAWVINAILDFIGERHYGQNLILAEVVNHQGIGVEPEKFRLFFRIVAASLREVLGTDWTPQIDTAWQTLLAELDRCILEPA